MRLAAAAPVPVISLAALSLGAALCMTSSAIDELDLVDADIALTPEPITVRSHHYAPPDHHSVWEGTYVCLQGLASLKLTIDVDSQGVATVRYDFGPTPSNPVIPKTGAFLLQGPLAFHGNGAFTADLVPTQWIVHPDDYIMAPLSLVTDDGTHLRGTIHYESCHDFQATRIQ